MKRSMRVSLVLVGSVSAMAMLSGCEEPAPQIPDNGGTFANMAECVAVYDKETCEAAEKIAKSEHLKNAPKFNTLEACRAEYGDMCDSGNNYGGSGDVFMPLMVGYMLGNAMSTPAPLYYGPGAYRYRDRRDYSAPIYTSGSGYSRSAPIGSGAYYNPKATTSTKASLKSSTAMTPPSSQRGGFGTSFKPTNSFKSTYASSNPQGVTRSTYSSVNSGSSYKSSTSVSQRGGFGSTGRSFGGGS